MSTQITIIPPAVQPNKPVLNVPATSVFDDIKLIVRVAAGLTKEATVNASHLTVTAASAALVVGAVNTSKGAQIIADQSAHMATRLASWVADKAKAMDELRKSR